MVIAARRSAFWLIVLVPVLFLFYQRFAGDPFRRMAILDGPNFIATDKATFLKPESPVVGLVFEGQPYAYPTASLAAAPVIVHADGDKRLLVMYSPYAGRAEAFVVDNTIKPRELDIVSMPADALLLYNARIGQFINAFTGATLAGEAPEGFKTPIETRRTNWREWRTLHPDSQVLAAGAARPPRSSRPASRPAPSTSSSPSTPAWCCCSPPRTPWPSRPARSPATPSRSTSTPAGPTSSSTASAAPAGSARLTASFRRPVPEVPPQGRQRQARRRLHRRRHRLPLEPRRPLPRRLRQGRSCSARQHRGRPCLRHAQVVHAGSRSAEGAVTPIASSSLARYSGRGPG